jgi:hypothetical protein
MTRAFISAGLLHKDFYTVRIIAETPRNKSFINFNHLFIALSNQVDKISNS